jgi:hypothetical protein
MTSIEYLIGGIIFGYMIRPFIDVTIKIIKNTFKKD